MKEVPHLVEIEEKYGKRGLRVLGISREDSATINQVVKGHKINYVVAQDHESFGPDAYDISGYPSIYQIDAQGNFLSSGIPSDEEIEKMIKDLVPNVIQRDVERSLKKAVSEYNAQSYGKAYSIALKVKEDDKSEAQEIEDAEYILDLIERHITPIKEKLVKFETAGELLELQDLLKRVKDNYKGHDLSDEASGKLKELKSDKEAKKEIKALEELVKIETKMGQPALSKSQLEAFKAQLIKFSEKNEEFYASKKASLMAAQLDERIALDNPSD